MDNFCKNCGNKLNEEDKFCLKCGAAVEENSPKSTNEQQTNIPNNNTAQNDNAMETTKTNAAAVGGFVCSLVGILIFGIIMGILAICLSVTAKRHMQVFPNEKGKGLATAALVIGIIDIVFSFIGSIFNMMNFL